LDPPAFRTLAEGLQLLADMTVLLVEDDPASLTAMREYFAATGHQVDCASSLSEAVSMLQNHRFELVITDLKLRPGPDTSGLEVVSAARQRDPDTRVIMLTAFGTAEVEAEARRRGVDRMLAKPVSLPLLSRLAQDIGR
jgi:DNA-binding response OmpR family regulator